MRRLLVPVLLASAVIASAAPVGHVPRPRVVGPPHEVTVVASDFAFQLPDTIAGGVTTITLRNSGSQPHELALLKLAAGHTLTEVVAAAQKEGAAPPWMVERGGPGAALPGAETRVTVDLAPGRYAILCGVPGKDGAPHFMKGMVRELTVTAPTRTAPEPTSDLTITLVDFDFRLSTPLTAGAHTIRVVNAGSQTHMMLLVRLAPGATVDTVLAALQDHRDSLPITWTTGASALGKGGVAYVHATLAPGTYGLACFMDDDTDGKSHIAHGMLKQFTVR